MTTGDLRNNLRKFHAELKLINYANELNVEGLGCGKPSAFLPVLHFVMTEFSFELAQYFYSKDYELLGKNDKNFVTIVYRILRDEFDSKPPLTKEQFFTLGFAERKLQFVTSVIQLCRKKNDLLKPKKRKNLLSSSSANSSKVNTCISGKTTSSTISTKNSNGTTCVENAKLVAMPKESSVMHIPQEKFDHTIVSKPATGSSESLQDCHTYSSSRGLSEGNTLTVPEDESIINDQDFIPRKLQDNYAARVDKNIYYYNNSVKSRTEAFSSMNPLPLQERVWDSSDINDIFGNPHAAKENTCPNEGKHTLGLMRQSHQKQSIMLSPIPLSNRMTSGLGSRSEKQVRKDNPESIPFVNYFSSPELTSKHIFVAQPSEAEGIRNPSENNSKNMLLDKHFQDFANFLDYAQELEERIDLLEKEAVERNSRLEELVETNSKLNARLMVLETAVALMQEKLES